MANVVTLWSKTADFTNAVLVFPGVTGKALWDSEADATKFYGTNGDYISSDSGDGSTYTNAGSDGTIAIADTTGILAGMYCYVDDVSAGTNSPGYYLITLVTLNTTITISSDNLDGTIGDLDNNDTISYYIGGVGLPFNDGTDVQDFLNFIGPACGATIGNAINNLDILCHGSTATSTTATIDIDAISGSATTKVKLIGTNSSFEDDGTLVEITTATSLVNGLIAGGASIVRIDWENFDFNAGGVGAADYCVKSSIDTTDFWTFINCTFQEARDADGVSLGADFWTFIGCTFLNNGDGFVAENADGATCVFIGCVFKDNLARGMYLEQFSCTVDSCIFDGNGSVGLRIEANLSGMLINNNTFIGNEDSGLHIESGNTRNIVTNNTFSGSVSAYGVLYDSTTLTAMSIFRNNHSHGNALGYASINGTVISTAGDFEDLINGKNVTGDPKINATTYIPASDSPLIDAGVGGTGDTIGALCAEAGGGAGGQVNLLAGPLG
jgi:hypothetical protein